MVLYLRQEGRGIGLLEKLKAYNLQDVGYDTVDANILLGHGADLRDYEVAALILKDIGVKSVRVLTNNPSKIDGLKKFGIEVSSREALQPRITVENKGYIETKASRLGHLLDLPSLPKQMESGANGTSHAPRETRRRNAEFGSSIGNLVLRPEPRWLHRRQAGQSNPPQQSRVRGDDPQCSGCPRCHIGRHRDRARG